MKKYIVIVTVALLLGACTNLWEYTYSDDDKLKYDQILAENPKLITSYEETISPLLDELEKSKHRHNKNANSKIVSERDVSLEHYTLAREFDICLNGGEYRNYNPKFVDAENCACFARISLFHLVEDSIKYRATNFQITTKRSMSHFMAEALDPNSKVYDYVRSRRIAQSKARSECIVDRKAEGEKKARLGKEDKEHREAFKKIQNVLYKKALARCKARYNERHVDCECYARNSMQLVREQFLQMARNTSPGVERSYLMEAAKTEAAMIEMCMKY